MNRFQLFFLLISFHGISLFGDAGPAMALEHIQNQRYEAAHALYAKAYETEITNEELLLSLGFTLKKMNRYQEAIAIYEHARPFISRVSRIERALSGAYLALGDYERGLPAYEYRWVNPPNYNLELQRYLAQGASLKNKIVLLKTEYGLGDTLQFIRYARELKEKGARVIVESPNSLIPLLSLCPYIDEIHPNGSVIPAHFIALLMSMPWILGTTVATIPAKSPYLFADPSLTTDWKKRLNPATMNIGICWQADMHAQSDNQTVVLDAKEKSIPLATVIRLADLPGIKLYSLQKAAHVIPIPAAYPLEQYADLDTNHGAFMDTAALMSNLDLVITIDTSIAHLAGGLGVPCWVLLCHGADWRWMIKRNDSPFYPTMRLFRQTQAGDWDSVIAAVIRELATILKARN